MKKHYTQMSSDEHKLLLSQVRSRTYRFLPHALDRMTEKRVTGEQILAMLSYCSIIELHNNVPNDLRVLVRGKVRGNFVCTVISLITNQIITVYWNGAGDYHKTLDTSQYQWTISVNQALKDYGI